MMQRSIWRALLGALVSSVGGLSMTNGIFPLLLVKVLEEIPLQTLINVRDSGLFIALMWAVCGAIVGWLGGTRTGGLILGLCGLVSGYTVGSLAQADTPQLITWGMFVGLLYGLPGGLIMGRVFPRPLSET